MVEIDMAFSNYPGNFEKPFGYNAAAMVVVQFK